MYPVVSYERLRAGRRVTNTLSLTISTNNNLPLIVFAIPLEASFDSAPIVKTRLETTLNTTEFQIINSDYALSAYNTLLLLKFEVKLTQCWNNDIQRNLNKA